MPSSIQTTDSGASQQTSISEVVRQLVIAVGEFLTVTLSDAGDRPGLAVWEHDSSPAVRAWIAGTAVPPNQDRLRFALEIARMLSRDHSNSQIQAWFGTVHPAFGEMPARVIGRRPLAELREPMQQAARV